MTVANTAEVLGSTAVRIEHVGEHVVDVQVSVSDLGEEDAYAPALERVGLQLRSRDHLHRYFRPFHGKVRDVHVHVCEVGSEWEVEHVQFRDILRGNPEACSRYARAKRDAVNFWADDGLAYTDAKTRVILEILQEARGAH